MLNQKKFYVCYDQDCGWTMMACHGIIEAPDLAYAKEHWEQLLRNQGYCVVPVDNYDGTSYNQLFEIPANRQMLSTKELLEIYK